ncbi:MAG: thiamine-phosphate kinase [Rhizobiaceae bacterium]
MAKPSEFEIIEGYFASLAGEGSYGLKDDAAELVPKTGYSLVITQDAIAENIHFFSKDAADLIARKAIRVNLSDLAAKGAIPQSVSVALGLGNDWSEEWISLFAKGLSVDCKEFGVTINGGDTFRTGGGFVISVTAIGEVPTGEYVSRLGAQSTDLLYVSGTIGDAALGLLVRQEIIEGISNEESTYLTNRYLLPQPRTELTGIIRKFASASMDVSDGFVGDLGKMCSVSGVSAEVKFQKIPFSEAARSVFECESRYIQSALTGGDDYEILFTISQSDQEELEQAISGLGLSVTCVGSIGEGEGVTVFDRDGSVIEFQTSHYDHSDMKN